MSIQDETRFRARRKEAIVSMANIRQIAKEANVSVSTVSRVLNGHPYVSEEKRNAVEQVIKKHRYDRNINAVHLSTGKTFMVGVVVPFTNRPYFAALLEGMAEEAFQSRYKLVFIQTKYEESREVEALEMLKYRQVDALIICSRTCQLEVIEPYTQYGNIVLYEKTVHTKMSGTYVNHYAVFKQALTYLHAKGHDQIGYSIGRLEGTNSVQRATAYRDFLTEINQPYRSEYVFSHCFHFEDGAELMKQWSKLDVRPTALMLTSDQVASGAITAAREQGIQIGTELAVIGFDNQPISRIFQLTTVDMKLSEIGRKTFRQALAEEISQEEIEVKFIERGSA